MVEDLPGSERSYRWGHRRCTWHTGTENTLMEINGPQWTERAQNRTACNKGTQAIVRVAARKWEVVRYKRLRRRLR